MNTCTRFCVNVVYMLMRSGDRFKVFITWQRKQSCRAPIILNFGTTRSVRALASRSGHLTPKKELQHLPGRLGGAQNRAGRGGEVKHPRAGNRTPVVQAVTNHRINWTILAPSCRRIQLKWSKYEETKEKTSKLRLKPFSFELCVESLH
jgi:hypothetical protein